MVVYNFKRIQVVPSSKDFIDIVLSKTQRKTPTVVHKHYKISRIRQFYMRKVKFTQETCHDRLSAILDEFPKLDDIHPFYADLINVLYDRDHYKIALGQLSIARQLISNLGKDFIRLLKFGDSLYRCKQLKRAALGRICTVMKKQGPALAYLEQVRQHLARLPSVDPNTRTIILCGYPNVGKSSFMNKVTRANVEVEPYAFTTKSLFVGHTDHKYLQWQVLDTPGILDHPLEDRNTIEMQSITALAHLRAAIVYILDISETCGFPLKQQVDLFNSIKPLFAGKPLVVAMNKTDLVSPQALSVENQAIISSLETSGATLIPMSNTNEKGVSAVKQTACDQLLAQRVESKLRGKKAEMIVSRIHIALPKPRDDKPRPSFIPESVRQKRTSEMDATMEEIRRLERDLEAEGGGPGVYSTDLRKHWDLKDDTWKYDSIPEIVDGRNIADFIDPDIMQRLEELEREEDALEAAYEASKAAEDVESDLDDEEKEILAAIKQKKTEAVIESHMRRSTKPKLPRGKREVDASVTRPKLEARGVHVPEDMQRGRKRGRSLSVAAERRMQREQGLEAMRDEGEEEEEETEKQKIKRLRADVSRSRAPKPRAPKDEGFKDTKAKSTAKRLNRAAQRRFSRNARKGEGDRVILNMMPKHLYAGKRGIGKTDRR